MGNETVIDIFERVRWLRTQAAALACRKREVMYQGGFGSGKSTWFQGDSILTAMENPGMPILLLRRSYNDVLASVVADMEAKFTSSDEAERRWPESILKGGKWGAGFSLNDRMPRLDFANGSHFLFEGWQTRDGKEDPKKFGSRPFGAVYIEEYSDLQKLAVYNYLSGRCRWKNSRNPNGYNRIGLSGNPGTRSHWSYEEFQVRPLKEPAVGERRAFFMAPTEENAQNLPADYIPSIKAAYPPSLAKRYLNGETGLIEDGEPVLKDVFLANTADGRPWHVAEEDIRAQKECIVWRSWDFGVLFAGCIFWQFHPDRDQIVVHHAILGRKNADALHFGIPVKMASMSIFPECVFEDFGDPAGSFRSQADGRSPYRVLREHHGIVVHAAPRQDWESRRDATIELFSQSRRGRPLVTIANNPGTLELRDSLAMGYQYPKVPVLTSDIQPVKNEYSHLGDAVTYFAVSILKDLRSGMLFRGGADAGRKKSLANTGPHVLDTGW